MSENVTIEFRTRGMAKTIQQFQKLESGIAKIDMAARKLRSVGRRMSTFVTLPLIAAGGAALKMASDAEEVANKFDVVMGPAAGRVRAELEGLTETIPATRAELEAAAAGMQDMLVPMGVARSEAAGMSADMVKLAGDLASFNNVPVVRALDAMKSALAGQSEPMRQFGVDTRVAALEQVALKEGLIEAGEEMDRTARAQAILLKIQEDSTDAMGDAARTADSTANSFKFLKRDLKAVGEELGRVLIPGAREMAQGLSRVLETVSDLDEDTQKLIVGLAAVATAMGPVLLVFTQLTIAITDVILTISAAGGLTAALGAVGAALASPAGIIALLVGGAGLAFGLGKVAKVMGNETMPATKRLREEMDKLTESTEALTEAQVTQRMTETATRFAALQNTISAIDDQIRELEERLKQSDAGGRFGLGDVGLQEDIRALREQKEGLKQRADIFRETIRELEQIQNQLQTQAQPGGPGRAGGGGVVGGIDFEVPDVAMRGIGTRVALPGGAPTQTPLSMLGLSQLQETAQRVAAQANRLDVSLGGLGADFEVVEELADRFGISVEEMADRLGIATSASETASASFNTIADVAITSMGQAVQAAIQGFDNIVNIVIQTVSSIVQSLGRQGGPLAGFLGGFGVPLIGAGLGILGAIIGGGRDRPQPVEIKNRDPIAVEEQQDTGPRSVIVRLIAPDSDEVIDEFMYESRRRERRDAVARIPGRAAFGRLG